MSSSQPHRCDEFPAEYSLASCSPAELASASSASLMLQPTNPVRRANFSERQPGSFRTVSIDGVTLLQAAAPGSVHSRSPHDARSRSVSMTGVDDFVGPTEVGP